MKDWWCKYPALSGYFGHCGRALRYLNEEVVRIRAEEPNSLLLVTGDLTAYAAKDQFETALAYLHDQITLSQGRKLGLQLGRDAVKMIPGNHDQWSGKEAQKLTDLVMYGGPSGEFRNTFPAMPVVLVEQPLSKDRKLVIVGIDTDAGLSASSPDRFLARGSFVHQLDQAEDLLDDDGEKQLRVLMLHHSRMHRHKLVCGIDRKSQTALEQFIRRHRISVLLTGHVHVCDSEVETVRHENSKWWLYESRCGTTTQRSSAPLGCPDMKLQPNSFLVHRIDEVADQLLHLVQRRFLRGPWTPFSSARITRITILP